MRFSKATLAAWIRLRMHNIELDYKFDPHNGTAQVKRGDVQMALAYGEWSALNDMLDAFGLPEAE